MASLRRLGVKEDFTTAAVNKIIRPGFSLFDADTASDAMILRELRDAGVAVAPPPVATSASLSAVERLRRARLAEAGDDRTSRLDKLEAELQVKGGDESALSATDRLAIHFARKQAAPAAPPVDHAIASDTPLARELAAMPAEKRLIALRQGRVIEQDIRSYQSLSAAAARLKAKGDIRLHHEAASRAAAIANRLAQAGVDPETLR